MLSFYRSLVFVFIFSNAIAQDIQFSQFYNVALYQNPAFAGSTHGSRVVMHQRIQWPGIDAKYTTSFLGLDHYFSKAKSGVGMYVLRDQQGIQTLSSTEMQFIYSYEIGLSKSVYLRTGLQLGYVSRYVNYNSLYFPDQFSNNGYLGVGTAEPIGNERKNILDVSGGLIVYSNHFWFGLSAYHLNQPNQSFYGDQSILPLKLNWIGGYKFQIKDKYKDQNYFITPTLYYKQQGKSDQLDAGIYIQYGHWIGGIWYRGLVFKRYSSNLPNYESLIFQFGYKYKGFVIGYSYDLTLSNLYRVGTGGAHEIHLSYLWNLPPRKNKPMKRLPCPHFYK
ncbi:MAG: type IX secretion system membrane protein PorP/SprF [Cytophagaceae bacterium]|jgi:type IX secretion system PorP/SprF family membrane protein|nr:type IX secretion system membrane protein PorP/SprF [Cytophagaceae bacterium]